MTTTYSYCDATLEHVFYQLKNFQDQGQPKDYEVRVDCVTVVSRTKDLGSFYLFEKSLTQFSRTVSVLFYKGNSRRYDKYDLNITVPPLTDSPLATHEFIDKEVENRMKKHQKQFKWEKIKEENKRLKKDNKHLRFRNTELEAKQSDGIKEIISMITSQFPMFNKGSELSGTIDGIELTELISMINDRRKKWGDDMFMRVIGVTMTLGDNLALLEETERLIESRMKQKNGNHEE